MTGRSTLLRNSLRDIVLALVAAAIALVLRLGPALDFSHWSYEVRLWSGPQPISWTFHLSCLAAFAALVAAIAALLDRIAGEVPFGSLAAMRRSALVAVLATIVASGLFIWVRPPNFPVSLVIIAGVVLLGLQGAARLVAAMSNGESRARLRQEIAGSPRTVNVMLAMLGLVVGLLALEAALRVYNPFGFRLRGDSIRLPANERIEFVNRNPQKMEARVLHTKNYLGFRGPPPPPAAEFAHHLTILTVGGSTTEEYYTSDDKTWTGRLATRASPHVSRLWVNNAGLIGHSTVGHLRLLEDYVAKLQPKLVLFLAGINDMGLGIGENDIHPLFGRAPDLEKQMDKGAHQIAPLLTILSEYSELASTGVNLARFAAAHSLGMTTAPIGANEGPYAPRDFATTDGSEAETIRLRTQPHLEAYRQRLRALVERTRSFGGEPVLLTQPLLWGPVRDPETGIDLGRVATRLHGIATSSAVFWSVLESYNDVARAVAAETGALLVDVARVLPKDSRYYFDIMHFSVAGSDRVAEIVWRDLCPFLKRRFPDYSAPGACS